MDKKVILITGASSGIGLRTALDLVAAGHIVYGGARRFTQMAQIAAAGGHALELDVTDDASMTTAIETIIAEQGRVDVLINNAGYGLYGAVEDVPMDVARAQMAVNVFGLARMCQLILPHMRARKTGRIINISSIGGSVYSPLGAWYHGSKHFVEGFTNSLRLEIRGKGLDAILIAPGVIETEFYGVLQNQLAKTSGQGAYADLAAAMAKSSEKMPGSKPTVVSRAIRNAVEAKRPRTIYRVGSGAVLLLVLRRILPTRWFDTLLLSYFGS